MKQPIKGEGLKNIAKIMNGIDPVHDFPSREDLYDLIQPNLRAIRVGIRRNGENDWKYPRIEGSFVIHGQAYRLIRNFPINEIPAGSEGEIIDSLAWDYADSYLMNNHRQNGK